MKPMKRKTEKKKCVARCRARHGHAWNVFRYELETLKGQIARMARELLQLEDAVGRLHRTGEALHAQVAATERKVEQFIQGQVMDCAEAKESYRRFVLGFLAFLDLLDEKLRLHRASAVRREMLERLLEVVGGRLSAGRFGEYLGDLGARTDVAGAFHEKWQRTMSELAGRFRELLPTEGAMDEIDGLSRKFDGRRFVDLLIVPSAGDVYDRDAMCARTVDADDMQAYSVGDVVMFGFENSSCLDERRKAVVKVVERSR